jgi:uncharacterized membrane protein
MAFKIKKNKCTLYLCASQVKLLNDFCYSYTPIPTRFLGEIFYTSAHMHTMHYKRNLVMVLRREIMNICIDLILLEGYCMCIGRYLKHSSWLMGRKNCPSTPVGCVLHVIWKKMTWKCWLVFFLMHCIHMCRGVENFPKQMGGDGCIRVTEVI